MAMPAVPTAGLVAAQPHLALGGPGPAVDRPACPRRPHDLFKGRVLLGIDPELRQPVGLGGMPPHQQGWPRPARRAGLSSRRGQPYPRPLGALAAAEPLPGLGRDVGCHLGHPHPPRHPLRRPGRRRPDAADRQDMGLAPTLTSASHPPVAPVGLIGNHPARGHPGIQRPFDRLPGELGLVRKPTVAGMPAPRQGARSANRASGTKGARSIRAWPAGLA